MTAEQIRLSVNQTLTVLDAADEALVLESLWAPAMTDLPPRHWHPSQTETFEVLEGELTVEIADAPARPFAAGERLELPPRTAHRMWNAGPVPAKAHWTITPALRTKEMFAHMAGGRSLLRDAQLVTRFRREFRLGSPRG